MKFIRSMSLVLGAAALLSGGAVQAEEIKRTNVPDFPIASVVQVPPGSTFYFLSGTVPPIVDAEAPKGSIRSFGSTKTQTVNVLNRIKDILAGQGLALGDVIQMTVFLVGDPEIGGRMDFAGMMEGYSQFFGTPDQPNKPTRSTVQVAGLVSPGMLVEIEVLAAKAPAPATP
ncbi:RidA family protein [Rhodospirillum centenum]|uniref:Endoribonuclease L-PSP, putative n=1 Tax=Rhodospirillum centenum (strain ATCC 51521 / SW) TaxID=414684 RepID=B6IY86_RHOCS|nr:RidA family protein [Rhodospirillum centenum]ACJ01260.1 endoribonuclease L-PSP, putative [Rhodospirillum centenum SW]